MMNEEELSEMSDDDLKERYTLAVEEWSDAEEEVRIWDNECETIQGIFKQRGIVFYV